MEARLNFIDVGARGGIPTDWMPHLHRLRPVMFEPSSDDAQWLRNVFGHNHPETDALIFEKALAGRDGPRVLNVTALGGCSSLYEPDADRLSRWAIAPAFRVVDRIGIEGFRYDTLHARAEAPDPHIIKLDTQGAELEVLQGFGDLLKGVLAVEAELHLQPIYKGQGLFHEVVDHLQAYGLHLRRLGVVANFDGDVVEVESFFTRDPTPDTAAGLDLVNSVRCLNVCDHGAYLAGLCG
jgi:FkbM family methyltransferase